MIKFDNFYQKEYPPHQGGGNEAIVSINVTLFSLGSFEEIQMTYTAKFLLQLEWFVVIIHIIKTGFLLSSF